ncbi:hypothetical protein SERLA73DRAFT_185784 [Serpula lacrymans var. lacrymans S7.3]|uniref:GST N-terminal domain-containing protein n=2 Tax=Serpula lacrymans var. lacrymans TaxID=341189 RepID=F8Q6D5_SERL3|nr:uncharacterized protein SERLADRAFT_474500 [Serpula lacrymans var. lacrymans S7.9]EGN96173.1 hypothetical protein SERLA73DRAFT_185784 [Serpula lacrymans var. lacrymans S7.3]EGO21717.1 hypothetical protein SERLADRAFT_474500 [Serpula lacrymans var. lacrymans S7.9]
MSQPIILYDIPAQVPGKAFSGNMFKARYILAYKGLAFKSVWIEAPDIEERMKAIGAKPSGRKPDGSDFYTLPTIQDPSTGAIVSDSFSIAEYLDETYPSKPAVFPPGTTALISAFDSALMNTLGPVFPVMAVMATPKLYPRTEEYLRKKAEATLGTKWEDFSPVGPKRDEDWKNIKVAFGIIDGWYSKSDGKWFMGDTFSHADVLVAAWMKSFSVLFDEDQWEEMRSWNGGRWGSIVEEISRYSILD